MAVSKHIVIANRKSLVGTAAVIFHFADNLQLPIPVAMETASSGTAIISGDWLIAVPRRRRKEGVFQNGS